MPMKSKYSLIPGARVVGKHLAHPKTILILSYIVSVGVSTALIWLNFTEYSIAGELGGSPRATANILGLLQFAAKGHEITILTSLLMVAQQFMDMTMDKALPLGVLLSSLTGPTSAVLMIPRKEWFRDRAVPPTGPPAPVYPSIMVRPAFEYTNTSGLYSSDPFAPEMLVTTEFGLQYWVDVAELHRELKTVPLPNSTYDMMSGSVSVRVDINSTPARSLDNGTTGRTYAQTTIRSEVAGYLMLIGNSRGTTPIQQAEAMLRWAGRKYVVNGTTMTVEVNCHYRPKEQCPTTPGSKSPAWCPQNLLLLFQDTVPALYPLRVYMTEGPRTDKYPGFTDSYEVILDTGYQWGIGGPQHLSNEAYTPIPTSKVIVCSILTTIQSSILTAQNAIFEPRHMDNSSPETRTILFHERWLDGTNWLRTTLSQRPTQFDSGNLTLPSRDMSVPTGNVHLARFGEVLGRSLYSVLSHPHLDVATNLETVVSGAFLTVYSCITYSDSQYPFRTAKLLSESLMPEPAFYPPERNRTMTVYNFGYGFRLSDMGKFAMAVLLAHAVVVVVGSLWKLLGCT